MGQVDPSIGYRVGEAQRKLQETYQNPLGPYATPEIRQKVLAAGNRDLLQTGGEQTREGIYDANRQRLDLAGLTRGTDTTGTSTAQGKVTQKDPWGTGLEFGKMLSM